MTVPAEALTRRQQQVCTRLVRGDTGKEIARSLGVSHRTIEDHKHHVMRKYGVHNVVMLVRAVYNITDGEPEQC